MVKEIKTTVIAVTIWFVVFFVVGLTIGYFGEFSIFGEPEVEIPKPILNSIFDTWGEFEDSSGVGFYFWVVNYGEIEAKNVEVTCKVWSYDNVIKEFKRNVGNIASKSMEYMEVIEYDIPSTPNENGGCFVSSCEGDCEILWKSIPEYVEIYGEE